jgi:spoIIIJ-associated protein
MLSEANKKLDKDDILKTVKQMVGFMNVNCQIEVKEESGDSYGDGAVFVSIQTLDGARFLIGKNGQNLKAMEHVLRAMFIKPDRSSGWGVKEGNIVLDVNDYRKSRASYLVDAAKQAVARVRNTQKAEALFPMSSYERRIVHMELASYPDIATESIGFDPNRRVIIKLFR